MCVLYILFHCSCLPPKLLIVSNYVLGPNQDILWLVLLSEILSPGDVLVIGRDNGYTGVAWFIGGPGRAGLMIGLNLRRPFQP